MILIVALIANTLNAFGWMMQTMTLKALNWMPK
jgi:hypothetical protein